MARLVVITGAGGLVGSVLARKAGAAGWDVRALGHAECDVTDPDSVRRAVRGGEGSRGGSGAVRVADVVVNCAAYTRVDDAERDPATANRVNARGAEHLAGACADVGAALIHVSTDYVFGGDAGRREPYEIGDPPAPVSMYGRSKRDGETAVVAHPSACVARTAWIFSGGGGGDFVSTMRRLAAGDEPVSVVADQVGSPTFVDDLAEALLGIADAGLTGVLHAANDGAVSRYDLAVAVFELLGADPGRVRPVSSDEHPRPAPRPAYSALSGVDSAEVGLTPLRGWRDALAAALAR